MKRKLFQTATRTISLSREIVVEFPDDVDPDLIDAKSLESAVGNADVQWETDDEDFEIDTGEWSDVDDDEEADVDYEE